MRVYGIGSDQLRAEVRTEGAELCRLTTASGRDLLWEGDPAVWGRQSPVLFPVVGGLVGNRLVHRGASYPMPRHGFARDADWSLKRLTAHSVSLRLRDGAGTWSHYPFPFELTLSYRVDGAVLRVQYDLRNPADLPLYASLGAHPALRWPLGPGLAREDHRLIFEKPEDTPVSRLDQDGLLAPGAEPNPARGREIALHDGLFKDDAMVLLGVKNRGLRYTVAGGPILDLTWEGFTDLGIWTRPGAGFLCLEPWRGHPSPADFDGEIHDKPGIVEVSPGATFSCAWSLKIQGV